VRTDQLAESAASFQHFVNALKRALLYKMDDLLVELIFIPDLQFQDVLRKRLAAVVSVENMYEFQLCLLCHVVSLLYMGALTLD
jgi:uncharacterized surface protein with fasciclin (FAS1) repeats